MRPPGVLSKTHIKYNTNHHGALPLCPGLIITRIIFIAGDGRLSGSSMFKTKVSFAKDSTCGTSIKATVGTGGVTPVGGKIASAS